MLFTEPAFLFCFLPVLIGLYFAAPKVARNLLLLAASLLFYAKGGGYFTYLLIVSVVFNYTMAIWIHRLKFTRAARPLLGIRRWIEPRGPRDLQVRDLRRRDAQRGACIDASLRYAVPHLVLPIGISFFTFHAISYVVDVYRGDADAQKSPVDAALYMLLFPQLIAGPIIRYRDIADQLARRVVTVDGFAYGVRRFMVGLAKKVLIANTVAGPPTGSSRCRRRELDRRPRLARRRLLHAADLLRLLRLLGHGDRPRRGCSASASPRTSTTRTSRRAFSEFWRRWHISLSNWFRDYLYIPLGGNAPAPARAYVEPGHRLPAVRPVARRELDVRDLGLYHGAFLVLELCACFDPSGRVDPGPRGSPRVRSPDGHRWMGVLSCRHAWRTRWVSWGRWPAWAARPRPVSHPSWYLDPQTLIAIVLGIAGSTPYTVRLARAADSPRIAIARARVRRDPAVDLRHVHRGPQLQPVHLFPLLIVSCETGSSSACSSRCFRCLSCVLRPGSQSAPPISTPIACMRARH